MYIFNFFFVNTSKPIDTKINTRILTTMKLYFILNSRFLLILTSSESFVVKAP